MCPNAFESVEAYLREIPKFKSVGATAANFDLSNFRKFCKFLGNPQEDFPSVHVAGTNGKGSTCRILSTVLQQAGYRVGIYTSPHINRFNERFRVDNQNISDDTLLTFFEQYQQKIEEYGLTYFEISTAIAFWWFAKKGVDIGVVEVGLGGRLDATNIINPLVSVITSISLDHTDILGETEQEIAREKGGIIKAGRPVVVGKLSAEARNEIRKISDQRGSDLMGIDHLKPQFIERGKYSLVIDGQERIFDSNLSAPVQANNIATAWQVLRQLEEEFPVTGEQFRKGLATIKGGTGRFERLTESQRWYFDGAHNVEAVKALKNTIRTLGNIEEATLVLSIMKDKVHNEVMNQFLEFPNIYYYQLNLERAATFDDIRGWLPQIKPFPSNRYEKLLLNDFDSGLVIFAGSFYFYVTVQDWVTHLYDR